MTDRELLELAAKAAGIECLHLDGKGGLVSTGFGEVVNWNPLTDDGDALRLAVKLGIQVWRDDDIIWCNGIASVAGEDQYAATRRAIVRAAAEIGRKV